MKIVAHKKSIQCPVFQFLGNRDAFNDWCNLYNQQMLNPPGPNPYVITPAGYCEVFFGYYCVMEYGQLWVYTPETFKKHFVILASGV